MNDAGFREHARGVGGGGGRRSRATAWLVLFALAAVLPGCGGYRLEVMAIESPVSDARFVPADRVPSGARPIRDARVTLYRDPGSLREEMAGNVRTDDEGFAMLRLDAFGAGWMVENWRIEATAPGHESVSVLQALPGKKDGMILLVEMPSGASDLPRRVDPLDDYRRFR